MSRRMLLTSLLSKKKTLLPSEFQEVEYIESTGTQYIDTGYIPQYPTARIEICFDLSSISGSSSTTFCVFGTGTAFTNGIALSADSAPSRPQFRFIYGDIFYTDLIPTINTKYNAYVSNAEYIINNIQSDIESLNVGLGLYSLYIFGTNRNGTVQNVTLSKMKLYSFKIFEENSLVRNFIPCYRKSDNEIGLYDLVNKVFYTNAGTGTFTKGSNIE